MASPSDDFLRDVLNDPENDPDWLKAAEAGRLSLQRFVTERSLGRVLTSRGTMRLVDPNPVQNSARIDEVGRLMRGFQRLVSAAGSSLEGSNKSLRGQLPGHIQSLTRLRLEAAPLPGSVVLRIIPDQPPAEELYPTGNVPMGDEQLPLVDRSLASIMSVLDRGLSSTPDDAGDAFVELISELGPRTASALREVMAPLYDVGMALGLGWAIPGRPTLRVHVPPGGAGRIIDLVSAQNLDAEEIVLRGRLHTISRIRAWDLETDEGEMIRLAMGSGLSDYTDYTVDALVEVVAEVVPKRQVGGEETYSYTALSVRPLEAGDE